MPQAGILRRLKVNTAEFPLRLRINTGEAIHSRAEEVEHTRSPINSYPKSTMEWIEEWRERLIQGINEDRGGPCTYAAMNSKTSAETRASEHDKPKCRVACNLNSSPRGKEMSRITVRPVKDFVARSARQWQPVHCTK